MLEIQKEVHKDFGIYLLHRESCPLLEEFQSPAHRLPQRSSQSCSWLCPVASAWPPFQPCALLAVLVPSLGTSPRKKSHTETGDQPLPGPACTLTPGTHSTRASASVRPPRLQPVFLLHTYKLYPVLLLFQTSQSARIVILTSAVSPLAVPCLSSSHYSGQNKKKGKATLDVHRLL